MSEKPKYETCRYAESVGQIAVYVKPACPRALMMKGNLVSTKTRCANCKSWRGRPAAKNPDFEKAVEEMVKHEKTDA